MAASRELHLGGRGGERATGSQNHRDHQDAHLRALPGWLARLQATGARCWRVAKDMQLRCFVLLSLRGGGSAFTLPQLAVGRAAVPRRVVHMAFYKPAAAAAAASPEQEVEDARTKYFDACAKKGVDSPQARVAMEVFKAALASQARSAKAKRALVMLMPFLVLVSCIFYNEVTTPWTALDALFFGPR